MYKAALLKFEDLSIDEPKKVSDTLSLVDIKYQGSPLYLKIHGVVAYDVFLPTEKFNSPHAFVLKPDMEDTPNLKALEEMLEEDALVQNVKLYQSFGKENKLNLKLKKNKEGNWVFTSNITPFKPEELIKQNTQLSVVVKPGFYIAPERYGLYFSLDSIIFDASKPSAIQPVTLKIGTKKRQTQSVAA